MKDLQNDTKIYQTVLAMKKQRLCLRGVSVSIFVGFLLTNIIEQFLNQTEPV